MKRVRGLFVRAMGFDAPWFAPWCVIGHGLIGNFEVRSFGLFSPTQCPKNDRNVNFWLILRQYLKLEIRYCLKSDQNVDFSRFLDNIQNWKLDII